MQFKKTLGSLVGLVLVLSMFSLVFAYPQSATTTEKTEKKEASAAHTAEEHALHEAIERGKALFADAKLGTSGKSCQSCHESEKFAGLAAKFPKYVKMAKKVMTLDQIIQFCIVNPLAGKPLAWDAQEITDLSAYLASLKKKPAAKPAPKPAEKK